MNLLHTYKMLGCYEFQRSTYKTWSLFSGAYSLVEFEEHKQNVLIM